MDVAEEIGEVGAARAFAIEEGAEHRGCVAAAAQIGRREHGADPGRRIRPVAAAQFAFVALARGNDPAIDHETERAEAALAVRRRRNRVKVAGVVGVAASRSPERCGVG
jgi:hypothetical protein